MSIPIKKSQIITELQQQIWHWQGFKQIEQKGADIGLGALENAFPGNTFPIGAIHEFISESWEETASSTGFMTGLISFLMQLDGVGLWIGSSDQLFAPAIKMFGLDPDRIIFVQMKKQVDILWALEEGLKCEGLRVVMAEIQDINFVESRRLQLAVEKSRTTGLILRQYPRFLGATTVAARWHVRPLVSEPEDDLPGVGAPQWRVELLKVRNGNPSRWQVVWKQGRLHAKRYAATQEKRGADSRKVG